MLLVIFQRLEDMTPRTLLGGSWVVICGVISSLIWVIALVILLIAPLITTHELSSRV